MARISVFGLGYVGTVTAACLANEGHVVVGVDPNETKVRLIDEGKSPLVEKGLAEHIHTAIAEGRLRATTDPQESVLATELSMICVGTPSQTNGSLDLKYVRNVCEEIGLALRHKEAFHVVVCRSTVLPGSMRSVVIATLEQYSGKRAGTEFGVCNNPEFLREGTAVHDFYNPPKTVIGQTDAKSGDMLASLYQDLDAPLIRTNIETGEMVKYVDNVWHALKVAFANEIGNVCKQVGIDSHDVMNIFCQDTKLNLSPYYMKPGFAFGGSCLPKDVRALNYKGKMLDLEMPIINAILPSNSQQLETGLRMVTSLGKKKIGVLGFSFKAGTDDLRESPLVEVIERLLGKGYDIRIYDKNVSVAKLMGANRDYLLNHIPHISNLMVESIDEAISHAELIVIGNKAPEFANIKEFVNPGQIVIDLVRVIQQPTEEGSYHGICW